MTQISPCLLLVSAGLLWLSLGAAPAFAEAPCSAAASRADLRGALQAAESAFGALDVETFTSSMDDAIFMVPCVHETLDSAEIARFDRLQGIRQFVANQEDRAVQSFAAARATEPDYQLPTWLVPEGSAIRDLYGRMPLENGTRERQPAPVQGSLRFDGVEGRERPVGWSTLVQVFDGTGAVIATAYLYPGDAMPAYAAVVEPVAARGSDGSAGSTGGRALSRKVGFGLIGAGVGSALGAGALYGLASASNADFNADHPEWDEGDLLRSQTHTNNLVIASGALGVLAAGAGLSAALVVEW